MQLEEPLARKLYERMPWELLEELAEFRILRLRDRLEKPSTDMETQMFRGGIAEMRNLLNLHEEISKKFS